MDDSMCVRHPDEKLRFVCVVCTTLICRDCKLTDHEGHKTKDIDTVATDIRDRLAPEKTEVDKRLNHTKLLRESMLCYLASFDKSIEETRSSTNKKLDAVIEWANTSRVILDRKITELESKGKLEMNFAVEYVDDNIKYFQQVSSAMAHALEGGANDHYVVRFNSDYENHKATTFTEEALTMRALESIISMTSTSISPDECQTAIEKFMGQPGLVRIVKSIPPSTHLSFVTRVPVSSYPKLVVEAILPMEDGSVSVLYHNLEQPAGSASYIAEFSMAGLKRAEHPIELYDIVMLEPIPSHLALFSANTESYYQTDEYCRPTFLETRKKKSSILYLKRQNNVATVVCEMDCPSHDAQSAPTVVVQLDVEDALKVAGNSSRQYFAVLTNSNLVKVYTRHASSALTTFDVKSHLDQVMLTDLCFFPLEGREVLLVSDYFYSVLLVVDHLNDCVLSSFFPSPYTAPTALYADVGGSLWIGCQGGRVVASLPPDGSDDDDTDLPEDQEEHLVPDVLGLLHHLPRTHMPPERPGWSADCKQDAGQNPPEVSLKPPRMRTSTVKTQQRLNQVKALLELKEEKSTADDSKREHLISTSSEPEHEQLNLPATSQMAEAAESGKKRTNPQAAFQMVESEDCADKQANLPTVYQKILAISAKSKDKQHDSQATLQMVKASESEDEESSPPAAFQMVKTAKCGDGKPSPPPVSQKVKAAECGDGKPSPPPVSQKVKAAECGDGKPSPPPVSQKVKAAECGDGKPSPPPVFQKVKAAECGDGKPSPPPVSQKVKAAECGDGKPSPPPVSQTVRSAQCNDEQPRPPVGAQLGRSQDKPATALRPLRFVTYGSDQQLSEGKPDSESTEYNYPHTLSPASVEDQDDEDEWTSTC